MPSTQAMNRRSTAHRNHSGDLESSLQGSKRTLRDSGPSDIEPAAGTDAAEGW